MSAEAAEDGQSVDLVLRNREAWRISSNAPSVAVEESVFLADERGPQPNLQVVLSGMMAEAREVTIVWRVERTAGSGSLPRADPNEGSPAA